MTLQNKFWYERSGVAVVAAAPYYIDTPFLAEWSDWTPHSEAQDQLAKSAQGKKFLT